MFTPRIITFACPTCPKIVQEANCFSSGRYCPFQPKYLAYDDSSDGGLSDSFRDRDERLQEVSKTVPDLTLLLESLREKCLYNMISKTDNTQTYKTWYNYMVYMQMDIAFRNELTKENSDRAFDFLDINSDDIEKCVNDSFVEPGNYQSDNKILREDREW